MDDTTPKRATPIETKMIALLRSILSSSCIKVVTTSIKEIVEVSAAIPNKTKKSVAQRLENGKC